MQTINPKRSAEMAHGIDVTLEKCMRKREEISIFFCDNGWGH